MLFLLLFIPAISRKRYVKEKLFDQILTELCARQYEKPNGFEPNSEYSDKFGSTNDGDSGQQVQWQFNILKFNAREYRIASYLIDQKMPNNNFKLYGKNSHGISFWNTVVTNERGHFKQYHPLTKLNAECLDEQWR